MNFFKYPTYERSQVSFLNAYSANLTAYLRRRYPQVDITEIKAFVKNEIETNIKRPKMETVMYPSYGNAELKSIDLLSYTKTMRENIITPAGVLYIQPSKKQSFIRKKITNNLAARKKQKKKMLEAAAIGDLVVEQTYNYLQSSTKIETNSIPGAFGSPFNCLFDIPGYNAITALSRHAIMCGYAHVEKLVAGNFYWPTVDHMINYCINHCRLCPPNVMEVVRRHNLYVPTVEDVTEHFIDSLKNYMFINDLIYGRVCKAVFALSDAERTFVYYAYCLKTLMKKNEKFFRNYLGEFFRTDVTPSSAEPSKIYGLNSDLLAMVTALNSDLIERKTVSDAITENPEGIKHLHGIGNHMAARLDDIRDVLEVFMRVDCDTSDAMSHPNMLRKTVIISDTDSVLFSTQEWIEWYTGKISFEKAAYQVNAFVVFLVVMTLEQVFARLSTNLGAENDDIYKIAMKNEFMYPLMLRTPLPKQYAGLVEIQEGFVLPKTKKDVKGLSFRSSTLCKETIAAGAAFHDWIFAEVKAHGTLKASDCIQKALDHEKRIITSIMEGEKTFLTSDPIKDGEDYKNADISIFYYWQLWDKVFVPKFGEFVIPNKGYKLPLINDGKILKNEEYLKRVAMYDKALHDRLIKFMEENPRKITSIYIPMTLKRIPEILRPVIDIRGIVYSNATPFMVTLRSLGLGYTDANSQVMLSDLYA